MHEPLINVPLYGHVCRVFDSSDAIVKRGETILYYIMAVSFIGGGNRSTRRKLPTFRKSLKKRNIVSSTPRLSWIRTYNVSGDKH